MNEISEKVKAAGVVGAGGAGFPTHVKLSAKADVFVVNGAECEPMLRNDQQLMAKSPELLVKGLNWAMQATGAKEGIIALKAKYGEAIAALQPMLAAADGNGGCGGADLLAAGLAAGGRAGWGDRPAAAAHRGRRDGPGLGHPAGLLAESCAVWPDRT